MNFTRPGAVDLSGLAGGAEGAVGGGSWAFDVTEENFQADVVQASMRYIVVLSLWSPRSAQSVAFNEVLENIVGGYEGRIALAKVDVDASPAVAQALGAQAVPFVVGLLRGQPVPLFQGTAEEAEVRQIFDQLVTAAVQGGVTGRAESLGEPAATDGDEPAADPRFEAADALLEAGDLDGAVAEYEKLQAQYPADQEIAERLAGVRLMARTRGADLQTARTAAGNSPDDIDAQMLVADLDVSGGHVEDAFSRLIDLIKRTAGDDRETVRARLLELFTVVGISDPRVATARRALASALF
jgi:putative thioredoxin